MGEVFHRKLFMDGAAGRLEAMLWTTDRQSDLAGLVCHPHPLFGGTMHNKVVYQAAKAMHRSGIPVLRFNFRGVGLSEGQHDRGHGEQDDVQTALDYLERELTGRNIVLAGFSFGAWVGLKVGCKRARVERMIGLGLPVNNIDMSYLTSCAKPKLLVQGGNDQFGAREKIEALFATLSEPKKLVIVEGVDHFFAGKLPEVGAAITEWLAERPE